MTARARLCENGADCDGESAEKTACNQKACPRWMPWNEWTPCSETCGGGLKRRKRKCKGKHRDTAFLFSLTPIVN